MDRNTCPYLLRSPLSHVDMLAVMQRGTAEVIAENDKGVLLYEQISHAYMLSAADKQTALILIENIKQPHLMIVHQDFAVDIAVKCLGLRLIMQCFQTRWPYQHPPIIPANPAFSFHKLEMERAEEAAGIYSHDLDVEYIRGRVNAGEMFGAYSQGELAGFIGIHEEGSMGMLEVLPSFRRQGVGSLLVARLCAYQLSRGLIPFSQFTAGNIASDQLHRSMGFNISEDSVYWLEYK